MVLAQWGRAGVGLIQTEEPPCVPELSPSFARDWANGSQFPCLHLMLTKHHRGDLNGHL